MILRRGRWDAAGASIALPELPHAALPVRPSECEEGRRSHSDQELPQIGPWTGG